MKSKPRTKAGKQSKMHAVMHEYKTGALKSSSGSPVKSRSQAIAIGMSESGQGRKTKARRKS
jgi:hypothetical protein